MSWSPPAGVIDKQTFVRTAVDVDVLDTATTGAQNGCFRITVNGPAS